MSRLLQNAKAAALGFALLGLMTVAAAAEKRVALVIGNSAYKTVGALTNPANDAKLMKTSLESVGFTVTLAESVGRDAFVGALRNFRDQADGADWAIVYYAGHGMEVGGTNYLIPVDAKLAQDRDIGFEAIPLDQVMVAIEGAKGLRMVVLDACRNNPFVSSMQKSGGAGRDIGRGLALVEPVQATLVAYAAKAGTIAADGNGVNSPYAAALAKRIAEPGVEVSKIFRLVRDDVLDATGQKQEPFTYGSLPGRQDFYFSPPAGPIGNTTPALGPGGVSVEQIAIDYQAAERVGTPAAWDIFLARYQDANSFYVQLAHEARQKVALLTPPNQPLPNTARPTTPNTAGCQGGVVAAIGNLAAALPPQRCMRPKELFSDCADGCPEMVVLPMGSFTMGSPPTEAARAEDEGPQHQVTIGVPLAVGRYEVTRGQFNAFVTATGYRTGAACRVMNTTGTGFIDALGKSYRDAGYRQEDNHPAVCISYDDAKAYTAWLSKKTGKPYRLLTETEWEYAARGGTTTAYWFGQDTTRICGFGNGADQTGKAQFAGWTAVACRDGYVFTSPAGSYSANDFGIYDMAGNAAEWTEDCYRNGYIGAAQNGAAWQGTGDCRARVLRGGSWYSVQKILRSADRDAAPPALRYANIGFRVARVLSE